MNIKLDIDGVLRNMEDPMLKVYNDRFGTNLTRDNIFSYDVNKVFGLASNPFDFFFREHAQETIVDAEAYPGAAEATAELRSLGHTITIVSYQPSTEAKIETLRWLERHNIQYDNIVFTNRPTKKSIKCDMIIDDHLDYLHESDEQIKICIAHAYNINAGGRINRVHSLAEFVNTWKKSGINV